jgi:hypothetical protein
MASKSTPGLLKAIDDFTAEHGSSKEHQPIAALLSKAVSGLKGGNNAGRDTPGSKAAARASMPAEEAHTSGGGNKNANTPGSADAPDPLADIAPGNGRDDRLTGTAAVSSEGERKANLPSNGLPPGTAEIRRIAAQRELSRSDTKMKPGAHKPGDSNKESNPKGEGLPTDNSSDPGTPPLKGAGDAIAQRAASQAQTQPEAAPPRVSQQPDAFVTAGQKAREMFKKKAA